MVARSGTRSGSGAAVDGAIKDGASLLTQRRCLAYHPCTATQVCCGIVVVMMNYMSSTSQPVGYKSGLFMQHLRTHKHRLRALGLQIIIHPTHAPTNRVSATHHVCILFLARPSLCSAEIRCCDLCSPQGSSRHTTRTPSFTTL